MKKEKQKTAIDNTGQDLREERIGKMAYIMVKKSQTLVKNDMFICSGRLSIELNRPLYRPERIIIYKKKTPMESTQILYPPGNILIFIFQNKIKAFVE